MKDEIERRFFVSRLPWNLGQYPFSHIEQGYMEVPEEYADVLETRLRKEGDTYLFTVKLKEGSKRKEENIPLTMEYFNTQWFMTEGRRLEKIRYKIPSHGNTIEVNIYCGKLEQLVVAEVEFSNYEERDSFIPPDWLGKEVTDDQRYDNFNLAVQGFPYPK